MSISGTTQKFFKAGALFGTILVTLTATARPEYAVRYGINRCTACHFSPGGGGARNLNGKYFGAAGYSSNTWVRQQDYGGAELKMLYYRPAKTDQTKGGLGTMNGEVWVSLPLEEMSQDTAEVRMVAEQNLGGFGAGPRQWYVRWAFTKDTETSWLPQYILLGRIVAPFGLMTDEHRTYVRMQTGTPWNTGFDTGVLFSANPYESIHYDLAAVNGQKNTGQALATDGADLFGGIFNLRWTPTSLPVSLGASYSWYSATQQSDAATASSIYGLLSMHRLSGNRVPVTVSVEYANAKNWNDTFTSSFVNDPAYAATVKHSSSRGLYALVEWEPHRRFVIQYKYDQLILDQEFPSDAFHRHGLGLKHYFGNNMWMLMRFERADTNRPGESNGLKTGDLNAAWGLINFSI